MLSILLAVGLIAAKSPDVDSPADSVWATASRVDSLRPPPPVTPVAKGDSAALPPRDFRIARTPYPLAPQPVMSPFGLTLSTWGRRGWLQFTIPSRDASRRLFFAVGGAFELKNSNSGAIRYRDQTTEFQPRFGCQWTAPQVEATREWGIGLFAEVGLQVRFVELRSVIDSGATRPVIPDRAPNPFLVDATVTETSQWGVQPFVGVGARKWIFERRLAVQAETRFGPQWLFGDNSRFGICQWSSWGLEAQF